MEIGIGVGEFNAFILTDEGRHHNENLFNSSYCLEKVYLFKGHAKRFLFIDREPMFETTEQVENLSSGDNVHELKQVPKRRNPKLDGNMRVDEHHNLIQD